MADDIGAAGTSDKGWNALVVGAGPAGLMAAEILSAGGARVLVADRMPSPGRKFLMAGKSGLNVTLTAEPDAVAAATDAAGRLGPILADFPPSAIRDWATGLGQETFAGSTGRVFPVAMKASPLLRAWTARLAATGATLRTRWRWTGFDGAEAVFDTPEGVRRIAVPVTVLAMGGASWRRLGADGAWAEALAEDGAPVRPFAPANVGVAVDWTAKMAPRFGQPVKSVRWRAGPYESRGEATLSARGLEGGGIYTVAAGVRDGAPLTVDLLPDLDRAAIADRLSRPRGKATRSAWLRKTLRLDPVRLALLHEFADPAPEDLPATLKALPVRHAGLRPLDEAISVAGGLAWDGLTDGLMLRRRPGVFAAGEMLDWEAPTGGYLLTVCLATGRHAGAAALAHLRDTG